MTSKGKTGKEKDGQIDHHSTGRAESSQSATQEKLTTSAAEHTGSLATRTNTLQ